MKEARQTIIDLNALLKKHDALKNLRQELHTPMTNALLALSHLEGQLDIRNPQVVPNELKKNTNNIIFLIDDTPPENLSGEVKNQLNQIKHALQDIIDELYPNTANKLHK